MFDPQDERLMTADEACKVARETEVAVPKIKAELAERERQRAARRGEG